jgi:glycosyltransferase involved in cell wall biosynthesis
LDSAAPTLRLCLIGNPDSIHVRRWAEHFAARGFDVHIVTMYSPLQASPAGVAVDPLRRRADGVTSSSSARTTLSRFPGLLRLATAARLVRAGLRRTVARLQPDIVHAHYVSDYGFLATLTGHHPLVVSAWGSDLLVDPQQSAVTGAMVRWVLSRSELVTYDSRQVAGAARRLGAQPQQMLEVVMGVEEDYMRLAAFAPTPARRAPVIVSLRSLERPLYNVETIVRAMPDVLRAQPDARLVIGNDGALRPHLEQVAGELGVARSVEFVGFVQRPERLAELLGQASVYVSVPSSDGTSVTLLEAMAAGAYPVVSDLLSNGEWIDTTGGELVPVGGVSELAAAVVRGLTRPERREQAARRNLDVVRSRGLWERNMSVVEQAYRRLMGR